MPQLFRIGAYVVFFWSNESVPLECVHVHIAEGRPSANATKVWLTKSGHCILENNNSGISKNVLRNLMAIIETQSGLIGRKWLDYFGRIDYIC